MLYITVGWQFTILQIIFSGTKVMCHEGGCGCCVVSLTQTDPRSSELVTKSVNSVSTKVLNVCILRLKLIFHQDKLFQPSLISYFSLLFNNISHKWRSGAWNNPAVGQQPNPWGMEPPVFTIQSPTPARDEQIKLRQHKTWVSVTLKDIQWKPIKIAYSKTIIAIIIIMKTITTKEWKKKEYNWQIKWHDCKHAWL